MSSEATAPPRLHRILSEAMKELLEEGRIITIASLWDKLARQGITQLELPLSKESKQLVPLSVSTLKAYLLSASGHVALLSAPIEALTTLFAQLKHVDAAPPLPRPRPTTTLTIDPDWGLSDF